MYVALCFLCTFVEVDVSDGCIRSGVTEEPDRLDWIKLDHLNHQQLKIDASSQMELENLFKNWRFYSI
ncbi:MAG: hypothetical protein R2771_13045 [Saprospiraceae bacterium]